MSIYTIKLTSQLSVPSSRIRCQSFLHGPPASPACQSRLQSLAKKLWMCWYNSSQVHPPKYGLNVPLRRHFSPLFLLSLEGQQGEGAASVSFVNVTLIKAYM